jgi:hypothetical protein
MTLILKLLPDGYACKLCAWRRFATLPVAVMWAHGQGAERVIVLFR